MAQDVGTEHACRGTQLAEISALLLASGALLPKSAGVLRAGEGEIDQGEGAVDVARPRPVGESGIQRARLGYEIGPNKGGHRFPYRLVEGAPGACRGGELTRVGPM